MDSSRLPEDGVPQNGIGRIHTRRLHGGICFMSARWQERMVQLMFQRGHTENYEVLVAVPLGSFIAFSGVMTTTRAGTRAILVRTSELIARCERAMPDKQQAVSSERRYADHELLLVADDPTFRFALAMSDMTTAMRLALLEAGYREFATGILQERFEGGLAQPFTTTCRANGREYSLALTSEVKLKKLVIAGCERVFEITQSFRNEGMDAVHSPEFTLLEAYGVRQSCVDMMTLVERAVRSASERFHQHFPQATDAPDRPFERVSFQDAYRLCVDERGFDKDALARLVALYPGQFTSGMPRFTWIMKVVERLMAPRLDGAVFLTDIPAGLSPFVRSDRNRPEISARAFLLVGGLFVADIYEDESDSSVIRAAMEEQSRLSGRPLNQRYLDLLAFGIPSTAGVGLGLNRLFMAFLPMAGLPMHIKETMLYPL